MRDAQKRRRDGPRSCHEDPGQAGADDQEGMADEMPRDAGDQEQYGGQSDPCDEDADDVVMAVSGETTDKQEQRTKTKRQRRRICDE